MAKRLLSCDNEWKYDGKKFDYDYARILEEDWFGFVYLIEELSTGKKYIGEKSFHSFITPKGKKNKKKQESNWKKYPSSNKLLALHIKKVELDRNKKFKFTILALCKDKSVMKIVEAKYMLASHALMSEDWHNDNVKVNVITSYKNYSDRVEEIGLKKALKLF